MRCWSCAAPFEKAVVLRDSLIRGRDPGLGGPYRLYRCPECHAESKIESTPRGRYFASPEKEIAAVEYLFSWSEALTPENFLRVSCWHEEHGARRRRFFEQDGDLRYSRHSFRSLIRRIFARIFLGSKSEEGAPASSEPNAGASSAAAERRSAPRTPDKVRGPMSHPYRILGIAPDAGEDEVRRAFHELVRRWHPDKLADADSKLLAEANRRLQELVQAYHRITSNR